MAIFISITIILAVLAVFGFILIEHHVDLGGILIVIGIIGLFIVLLFGGAAGLFGFRTTTEKSTMSFSKALMSDKGSVVIVYNGKPYRFEQADVVNNYDSISNIVIIEGRSPFNCLASFNIRVDAGKTHTLAEEPTQ